MATAHDPEDYDRAAAPPTKEDQDRRSAIQVVIAKMETQHQKAYVLVNDVMREQREQAKLNAFARLEAIVAGRNPNTAAAQRRAAGQTNSVREGQPPPISSINAAYQNSTGTSQTASASQNLAAINAAVANGTQNSSNSSALQQAIKKRISLSGGTQQQDVPPMVGFQYHGGGNNTPSTSTPTTQDPPTGGAPTTNGTGGTAAGGTKSPLAFDVASILTNKSVTELPSSVSAIVAKVQPPPNNGGAAPTTAAGGGTHLPPINPNDNKTNGGASGSSIQAPQQQQPTTAPAKSGKPVDPFKVNVPTFSIDSITPPTAQLQHSYSGDGLPVATASHSAAHSHSSVPQLPLKPTAVTPQPHYHGDHDDVDKAALKAALMSAFAPVSGKDGTNPAPATQQCDAPPGCEKWARARDNDRPLMPTAPSDISPHGPRQRARGLGDSSSREEVPSPAAAAMHPEEKADVMNQLKMFFKQ